MKYDNQLNYAVKVIENYGGEIPLHNWLKDFYRRRPQMGSNDRKQISNMVYGFYRLGRAAGNLDRGERILLAMFLCSSAASDLLNHFKPDWNKQIGERTESKIQTCRDTGIDFHLKDIFPWKDQLSPGIDHEAFCRSFLVQPDLFIRVRPGHEKNVLKRLQELRIQYECLAPSAIRLPNTTKVDKIFRLNSEIVVQDYSSQKLQDFFSLNSGADLSHGSAWDCCSASGGKSILLYDKFPGVKLTVSDIRPSILFNLKKRFEEAGISNYFSFIADLAKASPQIAALSAGFDLIILDAPCTGSGTWSRTPEELYFFEEGSISRFSELQRKISSHVIDKLKKGGNLVYITCSVFRRENEEIEGFIRDKMACGETERALIKGYTQRADSMFVATFSA